jgi:hypothetical protein
MDTLEKVCKDMKLNFRRAKDGATLSAGSYGGNAAKGVFAVQLPGWNYEVMIDADGMAHYDNFGGHWGNEEEFNKLQQRYSRRVVQDQLVEQGFRLDEETTEQDGTLQLVFAQ